jgi:hypothetical protein
MEDIEGRRQQRLLGLPRWHGGRCFDVGMPHSRDDRYEEETINSGRNGLTGKEINMVEREIICPGSTVTIEGGGI